MFPSSGLLRLVITAVPMARWGGGGARFRFFLSMPADDVEGREAVTATEVDAAEEAELCASSISVNRSQKVTHPSCLSDWK